MTDRRSSRPGLMLSCELPPRELIELVELAEHLDYAELWYTDQRFWRDCYSGLTLAAQHTHQILLGPGVNDPYTRHPATIAMAIATLDEISGGRAQLGLGVGGSGIAQMRLPKTRPVRALREAIEMVQQMLAEPTVDYSGEIFHLDGGGLGFTPLRRSIPVYIATHSPLTLRLSGRLADGVLLGNMATEAAIADAVSYIHEGERQANRAPGSVKVNLRLEALISDDPEPALATMKRRFAVRLISTYPHWEYLQRLGVSPTPEMVAAAETKDRDVLSRLLSDADVQTTALVGNRDDVSDQLGRLLGLGLDRITIRPYATPGSTLLSTIRDFGAHAWPTATARHTGDIGAE